MLASYFRILSLDGGGIRGLMTAIWLDRLEQLLEEPIGKHFDLVAGTSTGSILACAVSAGIPASKIVDMYVDHGREVFPAGASLLWNRLGRAFTQGVSHPKYDGKGLEKVLQRVFGDTLFGDLAITPTLVTSYNTLDREAVVFKNNKPMHAKMPVWEVCRASCAAPVYFPAHVARIGKAKAPLIDGGVVANNPTVCAIAEGLYVSESKSSGLGLKQFVVASFGTGATTRPITIDEAREWGAIEWAIPIIDVLFDGAADAAHYVAECLVPNGQYFRFQTELLKAYDDMDNADATNLNALMSTAQSYLDSKGGLKLLERLAAALTAQASAPAGLSH